MSKYVFRVTYMCIMSKYKGFMIKETLVFNSQDCDYTLDYAFIINPFSASAAGMYFDTMHIGP